MTKRKAYRLQLDPKLYNTVQEAAHDQRIPMNEFITNALVVAVDGNERKPIVLGWVKLARWGELSDRDDEGRPAIDCPECGQGMTKDAAYIGLLSNGQHYGPVCDICAVSE